ncbi:2-polyprenylphenol 6-hydroxylase [Neoehrlichia mikurensis]|uniref:2-polyprenylphenol 6-hydroxylase n=1 Tax=Neoehrlichia mikurensis TaxID=89586 RepID=A0A9Q9BWH1_9RICK|nr:2-polyprenylphenol 6-hydroxylase [Neoehrlichia mikurensis]UTO55216.1 2-polyprenylphenol 6-hydroxylase [Neoehrlichia mikurensis]UTO56136.1 2-polyprenylphenol 6-hydroxylase [Neoehrlichia mikurensis]
MFISIINIIRLFQIFTLLVRYNILPYTYFLSKKSIRCKTTGQKIKIVLQKLGPVFIKFGQSLSARVDIVGEDIASNLLSLCDKLPSFSYNEAIKIIEDDFCCKIENIFCSLSKEPIAAASIAQVHKATTIDGEIKAVKILRPNIDKIFDKDIKLMFWLASLAHNFKSLQRFQILELVKMFSEMCKLELDLRFEAANAEELKKNIKSGDKFYVPEIDWNRTTRHVLTSQWIDATPIYEIDKIKNHNDVAKNLIFCFCNQVYRDRFFHADMHPGNLMVDENNNIIAIDFGIMGRLDEITCIYMSEILLGFLRRDYKYVADIHYKAGYVSERYDNFVTACCAIGEPIAGKNAQNISIAGLLAQLFKVTSDFNMKVQPQLLLLQKTMVLVEGLCRQLSPNINMWQIVELWMKDCNNYNSSKCIKKLKGSYLYRTIQDIPLLVKKIDRSLDAIINYQNLKQPRKHDASLIYICIIIVLIIKIIIG